MRLLSLAALCLTLPTLAVAQTFKAENRLNVVPLNANDFEVIEARGEGARGMWCAAADYAQARLPRGDGRLYVKRARSAALTASGRKGVVFTNAPATLAAPASTSLSVSVRQVGRSLPIAHAYRFCRDNDDDRDDLLFRLTR